MKGLVSAQSARLQLVALLSGIECVGNIYILYGGTANTINAPVLCTFR